MLSSINNVKKYALFSIVLLLNFFCCINVNAINIDVKDVELKDKSSSAIVEGPVLKNNVINSDIHLNRVKAYVEYEIKISNNEDQLLTIKKIKNNLKQKNIVFDYEYKKNIEKNEVNTLKVKITYDKKIEKSIKDKDLELSLDIKEEDDILKYFICLISATLGVIFVITTRKHKNLRLTIGIIILIPILILVYWSLDSKSYKIKMGKISVVGYNRTNNPDTGYDGDYISIVINPGNGEEPIVKKLNYGDKLGTLPTPSKEGYDFDSWEDESGNKVTEDTEVTEDMDLEAKYTPKNYKIKYVLNGGTQNENNPTTYNADSENIVLEAPYRESYTFKGWTGSNGTDIEKKVTVKKGTTGNLKFVAHYSKEASELTVSLSSNEYTYTGKEIKPSVVVKDGDVTLREGIDYSVSYSNNKDAGTGIVEIRMLDSDNETTNSNYTGNIIKYFDINKLTPTVTSRNQAFDYTGNKIKINTQTVTVNPKINANISIKYYSDKKGKNEIKEIKNIGTYYFKAYVDETDNTTKASSPIYSIIVDKDIVDIPTANNNTPIVYNGKEQVLLEDTDKYKVTGEKTGKDAGDYTVTVIPTNNYTWPDGTTTPKEITISIKPYDISNSYVSNVDNITYDGTNKTPKPNVVVPLPSLDNPTTLTNSDITYSYENNKNAGTATITITGKGNYTGSTTKQFTIDKAAGHVILSENSKTIKYGTNSINFDIDSTHGGDISFEIDNAYVSAVVNNKKVIVNGLSTINVGTQVKVNVTSKETNNYLSANAEYIINIEKATPTVHLDTKNTTYTGNLITVSLDDVIVTPNTEGTKIIKYYSDNNCNNELSEIISAGTYYMRAEVSETDNYTSAQSNVATLIVSNKATEIPTQDSEHQLTYTGEEQTLLESTDKYTVTGNNVGTNAGTYKVYVVPTNNYSWPDGSTTAKEVTIVIKPYDISNSYVSNVDNITYDGTNKTPTPNVVVPLPSIDNPTTLTNSDITYSYENNKNAGTATITITGKGNYTGSTTKEFTIDKAAGHVTLNENSKTIKYGTNSITFNITSHHGGEIDLTSNNESVTTQINNNTVSVTDLGNINVGTQVKVKVTSKETNNYLSANAEYIINIEKATPEVVLSNKTVTYTGEVITINTNEVEVTPNSDGIVTIKYYSDEELNHEISEIINSGTYYMQAEVSETDNYTSSLSNVVSLKVNRKSVEVPTQDSEHQLTYTGLEQTLLESTDKYTVTGNNKGTNAGTYKVNVVPNNNYAWPDGTTTPKEVTIVIKPFDISNAEVNNVENVTYDGTNHVPTPSISVLLPSNDDPTILTSNDITYSYENNKNAGTATITITGKGNYTGSTTKQFTIDKTAGYITLSADSKTIKYGTNSITFNITNHHGGEIELTSNNESVTTQINNNTVSVTDLGNINVGTQIKVKVTSKETNNYLSASEDYTINIEKATPVVHINNKVYVYDGSAKTISTDDVEVTPNSDGIVTIKYYSDEELEHEISEIIDYGTYYMQAEVSETSNYTNAVSNIATLTISKETTEIPTQDSEHQLTYTGLEQTLLESTDKYTVTGNNVGTNAGTYKVNVVPTDNYAWPDGTTTPKEVTVIIKPYDISGSYVSNVDNITYDGTNKTPKPNVVVPLPSIDNPTTLTNSDIKYSYENNKNAGTATITITGKGNYTGSTTKEFTIDKAAGHVTLNENSKTIKYGTNSITFNITSHHGGEIELTSNNESVTTQINNNTVSVTDLGNINVGTQIKVKVTSKETNNYLSANADYTISIEKATPVVHINNKVYVYDGSAKTISTDDVEVTPNSGGNVTIKYYSDEELEHEISEIIDYGTYYMQAEVSETSNYTNAVSNIATLTVSKEIIEIPTQDLEHQLTYTGEEQTLFTSTDKYTVTGNDKGTDSGTYKVNVVPTDNYAWPDGSTTPKEVTVIIKPYDISGSYVSNVDNITYDGTNKTPKPNVVVPLPSVDNPTTLTNSDITYSYENNKNAGTATITITGKGNYTGSTTKEFTIDKAAGHVTLNENSKSIQYGTNNLTFNITSYHGGEIELTSNNESVTTQINNNTVSVSNLGSISVGTQIKVKVTSKETNNYLSANADYTISIEKAAPEVTLSNKTVTYTGEVITINTNEVEVTPNTGGTKSIKYYSDSSLQNEVSVINAGTYYMKAFVTETSNYASAESSVATLNVERKVIEVPVQSSNILYNGTEQTLITNTEEYNVSGNTKGTDAGNYQIVVTPTSNYKWANGTNSKTMNYIIEPYDISSAFVDTIPNVTYNGEEKTPKPNVVVPLPSIDNPTTLTSSDVTYSYENNKNAGTATITITGKGNYTGSTTKQFTIGKANGFIELSETSSNILYGTNTISFTIENSHGGEIEITDDNEVVNETLNGNVVTLSNLSTLSTDTIVKVNVNCKSTSNYKESVEVYTLRVANAVLSGGSVSISGHNAVGDELTANVTNTNPVANYTYKWYRNDNNSTTGGAEIEGATNSKYTLTSSDAGKYIYVEVTASKEGYISKTFTDKVDSTNNGTDIAQTKALIPTTTECKSITYTGLSHVLTKEEHAGITYHNNSGINAGNYTVTAHLADGYVWSDYTTSDKTFTCSIAKSDTTTLLEDITTTYDGTSKSASGATSILNSTDESITGTYTYNYYNGNSCSGTALSSIPTDAGNYSVVAVLSGTSNYKTSSSTCAKLTINKLEATCTSSSATKVYDGTQLTSTGGTCTGLLSGDVATFTNTGVATNVYRKLGDVNNDGNITEEEDIDLIKDHLKGVITLDSYAAMNADVNEDGDISTSDITFIKSYLKGNSTLPVRNNYDNTIGSIIIKRSGVNVTSNYDITEVLGKLTITPRTVTYKANNQSKAYDGTALVANNSCTLTSGTLLSGHTATCTNIGSITDVGTTTKTLKTVAISDSSNNDVSGNYVITKVNGTLTITNQGDATTGSCNSLVYNGSEQVLASGAENATYTNNIATNAGNSYYVTVTANSGHTFSDGTTSKTLTCSIGKKSVTITASNQSKTYDGSSLDADSTCSVTSGSLISGHTVTCSNTGSITNAGSATKTLSSAVIKSGTTDVSSNYTITKSNGSLTVSRASVAEPSCTAATYNGSEQTLLAAKTSGAYTNSAIKGTNAGSYSTTLTLNSNYKWSSGSSVTSNRTKSCSIGTKSITVKASNQSKTYDGSALSADTTCSVTSGSVVSGHTVTCSNTGSITNAGSATKTLSSVTVKSGTTDVSSNYSITKSNGTLTINARSVTITASNQSKTYDGSALSADSTCSVTSGSLISGHTVTCTNTGSITNAGSATKTLSSAVIKSGTTDVSSNYTITKSNGSLTVSRASVAEPSCTAATYNGSEQTLLAAKTSGAYTNSAIKGTNAGSYSTTLTLNSNYKWSSGSSVTSNRTKSCSIGTKSITVTASNQSKTYDGSALSADSTCSVTSGSVVSGHTVTCSNTGSITNAGSATKTLSSVTVKSGTTDVSSNYTISKANGTLTVERASVAEPSCTAATYNGSEQTLLAAKTSGAYTNSAIKGTNAGSYSTTLTLNSNYKWASGSSVTSNRTKSCSISTKAITVTASNQSKTYDGSALSADETCSVTSGSLVSGHTVTCSSTGSITNAGSATKTLSSVTVKSGSTNVNSNYSITKANGTLTVNKRTVTVTASNQSKTYDESALTADSTCSVTSGSLVSGHTVTCTNTGSQTAAGSATKTLSSAVIKSGTTDVSSNYTITKANGTLTVNKRNITIKAIDIEKTYNGTALNADNSWIKPSGSLVSGHTVTVTTSGSITNVGSTNHVVSTVTIKNSGGTDVTSNYSVTKQNGTLTVKKREITVTASNQSKTYDGSALTADATCSVTTGSLVSGHAVTCSSTGSITNVGSATKTLSTVTVKSGTTDVSSNYAITKANGTLTVERASVAEPSCTAATYNGSEQTLLAAKSSGAYTNSAIKGTNAGSYSTTLTLNSNYKWSSGSSVTSNRTKSCSISTKSITVTATDQSKTYDGSALTANATCSVTSGSVVSGHTVTCTNTGSITNVGSTTKTLSSAVVKSGTTDVSSNYSITKSNGTLKVNQATPSGGSIVIAGRAAVGEQLVTTYIDTTPAATSKSYQWYRGSTAISGATGTGYKVTSSDVGYTIRVVVTTTYSNTNYKSKTIEDSIDSSNNYSATICSSIATLSVARSPITLELGGGTDYFTITPSHAGKLYYSKSGSGCSSVSLTNSSSHSSGMSVSANTGYNFTFAGTSGGTTSSCTYTFYLQPTSTSVLRSVNTTASISRVYGYWTLQVYPNSFTGVTASSSVYTVTASMINTSDGAVDMACTFSGPSTYFKMINVNGTNGTVTGSTYLITKSDSSTYHANIQFNTKPPSGGTKMTVSCSPESGLYKSKSETVTFKP